MRDKRSEGMKAIIARARRDLISRTARVWSRLGRSIIKERGAELDTWISRLMASAEEAVTKSTELDAPPFPPTWGDALRDDLLYAMAQGFWLQHVYMQEARAERQGKRYRVPEGDPTKAALEALTKRKMTLADSDDWHKVIPKDAIDWIEGYTPKLAGTLQKDVLERVKREVQGSLAKGTSVRERVKALRDASPKVAAMSKARVEAIARTEVTRADTMGRLLSMKRDEDVIGVEFSAVLDSRTTPGCERRHGLMMRLDDPRLPYNTPPLNVNCRSMLLPVSTWDAPDGLLTSHEFDDVDMPRGMQRPEDVEVVRATIEGRPIEELIRGVRKSEIDRLRGTRGHMPADSMDWQTIQEDYARVGIDIDEAEARGIAGAVGDYTGSYYKDMRNAFLKDRDGKTLDPDEAEMLARYSKLFEYTNVAPNFDYGKHAVTGGANIAITSEAGTIYRGISVSKSAQFAYEQALMALKVGDSFDLEMPSSFSSSREMANNYAKGHGIILRLTSNAWEDAPSIKGLSRASHEDEVLVGDFFYKVIKVEEQTWKDPALPYGEGWARVLTLEPADRRKEPLPNIVRMF